MAGFETASYEPSHREGYLGLLREAWGERSMSGAEFDWWFGANPAGSLMSVATIDGRVVGAAAHSLSRAVLDGAEQIASFSVHAVTHPSARGLGIFGALERKHEQEAAERGVAAALVFANELTAPIFLGVLGWSEIARLRVWARPLLRQSTSPAAETRFHDPRDAATAWSNHVVRDSDYLNWRFADSPKGYRVVRTETGHAVVGRTRKRVEVAVLADLVAPESEVRSLLKRAVAASSGRVMIALPAAEQRAAFLSLGFVPAPYTLRLMGKALAGKLSTDATAWRLTLGDTDFF
jgi:GNAT superfamily N-acetyltransferase